jgi:TonB family protein
MSMLRGRLLLPGMAIGLAAWIVWAYGSALLLRGAAASMPIPEDGTVTKGRYINEYFGLSYAVPDGLTQGLAGPEPSETGYYALTSFVPDGEFGGNILISAQDMFFEPNPHSDVAAEAHDFRDAMAHVDGMNIDQEPSEINIAGHVMRRVEFSGVGLYRATLVTEIRCHVLSFNLTARSPELLSSLALSLNTNLHNLPSEAGTDAAPSVPLCVKDYAVPENLLQRVEPVAVGAKFTSIPVRIVIDRSGSVDNVHVIHASDEQRRSIEDALRQWKFKPPRVDGKPVEIETGLMFRFASEQRS